MGVFARMLLELASEGAPTDALIPSQDASTASGFGRNGARGRLTGRTRGGISGRRVPSECRWPPPPADVRKRYWIENSFIGLKDCRRVPIRYNRRPKVLLSVCALAAAVMFWL